MATGGRRGVVEDKTSGQSGGQQPPPSGNGGGSSSTGTLYQVVKDESSQHDTCERNGCQLIRILIHVNDYRKDVLSVHAMGGQTKHIIIQKISRVNDKAVEKTELVDVEGRSDSQVRRVLTNWYGGLGFSETGVLYDSTLQAILGLPEGNPRGYMPRPVAITPTVTPAEPSQPQPHMPVVTKGSSPADVLAGSSEFLWLLLVPIPEQAEMAPHDKPSLAEQRARIGNMTKKDLENCFHMTQKLAARNFLRIGQTPLKKLCRRNELPRWPYRKIKAIDNKFNDQMKRKITSANLAIALEGVTAAFILRKEKEKLYEEILKEIPVELQGKEDVIREMEAAHAAGREDEYVEEEEDVQNQAGRQAGA